MGDPHNPKRIGETWNQERIDLQLKEIDSFKDLAVLSGGWAWHFMSPTHEELKILHDHKDIDIFVTPSDFETFRTRLIERGYERTHTKYDDPSGDFYRFVKRIDGWKIVIDAFLQTVQWIEAKGYRVVEPNLLLSYYGVKHTSEECIAVQAARKLLDKNQKTNLIDNKELILLSRRTPNIRRVKMDRRYFLGETSIENRDDYDSRRKEHRRKA